MESELRKMRVAVLGSGKMGGIILQALLKEQSAFTRADLRYRAA